MGRVRGVLDALSSARAPVAAAAPVGLLAALAPQDAEAGPVSVVDDVTGAVKRVIEAWHGSPHKFDKFDMSKIGTGEGAQAYGHGLYAADSRKTAEEYRDKLSNMAVDAMGGFAVPDVAVDDIRKMMAGADNAGDSLAAGALDELLTGDFSPDQIRKNIMRDAEIEGIDPSRALALFDEALEKTKNPGALYRLHINADPDTLLDWDKPLSEQPAIMEKLAEVYTVTGNIASDAMRYFSRPGIGKKSNPTGSDLMTYLREKAGGDAANATATARQAGIPGIRYLDQMSRGAGEGSHNYVVFDDSLMDIKERGAANPQLLAGMAGTGILAALAGKVGQGINFATDSMEMPTRGLHGLAQTVGTLATGGGWENAIRNGAQYAQQPLDTTAQQVGRYTADRTGNPYMASLMDALTRMASLEP